MGDWALMAATVIAAAVLLNAGLFKLVRPDDLRRAVAELVPAGRRAIPNAGVRAAASIEVIAGVGLVVPDTRRPAAVVAGVLGVAFVVLGAAGVARRSLEACGCLGVGGRPLGLINVIVGLSLVGVAIANVMAAITTTPVATTPVATALGMLGLCLWSNRRLAWLLLRPTRPATRGGA